MTDVVSLTVAGQGGGRRVTTHGEQILSVTTTVLILVCLLVSKAVLFSSSPAQLFAPALHPHFSSTFPSFFITPCFHCQHFNSLLLCSEFCSARHKSPITQTSLDSVTPHHSRVLISAFLSSPLQSFPSFQVYIILKERCMQSSTSIGGTKQAQQNNWIVFRCF